MKYDSILPKPTTPSIKNPANGAYSVKVMPSLPSGVKIEPLVKPKNGITAEY